MKECPRDQVRDENTNKCYTKKHIIEHPPNVVRLDMTKLYGLSRANLRRESWKRYNIDLGSEDEDDETYEKLYYSKDMRSEMGLLYEDETDFVVFPRYYVDRNPDGSVNFESHYSKCWKRLIQENHPLHVKY